MKNKPFLNSKMQEKESRNGKYPKSNFSCTKS